jgi:hypothetical protein
MQKRDNATLFSFIGFQFGVNKANKKIFIFFLPVGFPNVIVADGDEYLFDIQGLSIRFFGEWCVY